MTAVTNAGRSLCWASDELKGDREIVQNAVLNHGIALSFAAAELREIFMDDALATSPTLVGLKVMLLSGRHSLHVCEAHADPSCARWRPLRSL